MTNQIPDVETRLSILNDHYKDTFLHVKDFLKFRDKLFVYILVVISAMLFEMFSPRDFIDTLSQLILAKLEINSSMDLNFISSVLWFGLLGLVLKYFQTTVHIERQYNYIYDLEKLLSANYEEKAFTREGKSYLKNYPLFSKWTFFLYTWIFPFILMVIVVSKIITEMCSTVILSNLLIFNILMGVFILISSVLYLLLIHNKK